MTTGKGEDDHVAEFGMTGTTFTGASSTWMKALAIDSLGLPTKDESLQQVKLLIKNVTEIEDTTGEFLLHLPGGKSVDTKSWSKGWEWTQGIGLYGILRSYQMTGDPEMLKTMTDWFSAQFKLGTPSKNVNTMAAFLTLAYLYEITGEKSYLPYLDSWGEWAMNDLPRNEEGGFAHTTFVSDHLGQLWDDSLMMTVLPLAKIGMVLNRPHYVQEAKRQVLVHIKYLADRKTGLWFHGWTFEGRHNYANALWARGNSWVTIFIPEFLSLLSDSSLSASPSTFAAEAHLAPHDPIREYLLSTLQAQIDALVKYQDKETGLWNTLIDDPTSYLESSATAGFAFGILAALRKKYIVGEHYEQAAYAAVKGVVKRIQPSGELLDVSFGTPVFSNLQGYKDVPLTSMPYGQSMAMLMLGEYSRRFL
ncbi:glycoside hydrolase family 105 protein [Mrakia frigida]|uniref:glycoside hydrolase family 88/105 protein n=1 Tax=Mrakia frigida TaxID=29902 RepID=UPI003FCBFEA4